MPRKQIDKGRYLELRVARLLFAEGLTPFVNIYFRGDIASKYISQPDVDVMGCRFLPDATIFFAHYDCKSGASKVVNHILMLAGLRSQIPPGPMVYIRKQHTSLDIKRYAMQYGIRIADVSQIEERERKFVDPVFGDNFPSISDQGIYELWLSTKGKTKDKQIGRILKYFEQEFWAEGPYTRLRRSIAAVQLIQSACTEAGIVGDERDLLVACVIRYFLYSLLAAGAQVSFLSNQEIASVVQEWLITEKLAVLEYTGVIESTAQLIFDIYGDPAKGPLKEDDYYVPPPDYTEELISLIRRSIDLHEALPVAMPAFDALIIEEVLRKRKSIAKAILRETSTAQIEATKQWMRSVRLFLTTRQPSLTDWKGWEGITNNYAT